MAKLQQKYQAIRLRKQGKSLKEISEFLRVSKSTVSNWCRSIILKPEQILRLERKRKRAGKKGSVLAAERKRTHRLNEERELRVRGLKELGEINKRDLFISGIAIYWSEGYTYEGGDNVGFTNSDPRMILLMLKWFEEVCEVPKNRFSLSIRINQTHKDKIVKVEKYWSRLTGIPLSQFTKTILIKSKSKKVYPNSKPYYGTLRIIVLRGTQLRRRINGWLEGLAKVV